MVADSQSIITIRVPQSARIVSVYTGAICLGIHLVVYSISLRWLVFEKKGWKLRKNINWVVLVTATVLTLLDMTDSAVRLQSTIDPFVPDGSARVRNWQSIVMCTCVNMSALIADALLIYRCWVVYSKSYKHLILPVLLWIGCIICTVLQACWQFIQNGLLTSSFRPVSMPAGPGTILVPFWAFTIVLNVYATSMIIYRIWHVARDVEAHNSHSTGDLRFVIRVLMESGLLYVIVTIAHLAAWFGTNAAAIVVLSAMSLPVIGIAFSLIVIRTSQSSATTTFESHEEKSTIQFGQQNKRFPVVYYRQNDSDSTVHHEAI